MAAPEPLSPAGGAGEEAPEEDEDEAEAEDPERPNAGAGGGRSGGGGSSVSGGGGVGAGAGGCGGPGGALTRRAVTLRVLLKDALLEPGAGVLSIYYLGKKFLGDLQPDGRIMWQETGQIFNSPSAWATHCKKLVNPAKKSGCGWASVKYKGQKLDKYKATWLRLHQLHMPATAADESPASEGEEEELLIEEEEDDVLAGVSAEDKSRRPLGKSPSEPAHLVLTVLRAFPCRSRLGDAETAAAIEEEIYQSLFLRGLSLVGWYHSHPHSPALPSLQDIDAQMDYQLRLQGSSNGFQPCLALLCSPYYSGNPGPESKISPFWVMPPPEQRPSDYGIPMDVEMAYVQDSFLTNDILHEMMLLVEFYKGSPDLVRLQEAWSQEHTYLDKLKISLASRTPKDQSLCHVLEQVCGVLKQGS
ncbi:MPN domain-containing protein isoform X3 [Symphalangus syndactylus]|uniref:MPN domain-containing protein isoform X3 n=1 Tax=Symphalangus syndactylus TaxID=9590 RepID=UPI0024415034|nr:MPN domain-containing protein isoform X4 [Symphalangus syndactylus]XP_055106427.1 MPN domain-containing protein isoform X2 [Symphalangus syndactylus]